MLDDVVGAGQTLHESYEQAQAASDQVRQEHPHRSHATRVSEVYQQENRKQSDFSHRCPQENVLEFALNPVK